MAKIVNTLMLVLALNFLAIAGGVGWLVYGGHLDKERVTAIKGIMFPLPEAKVEEAAKPATQPVHPLDQLLAKYTGFSSDEKLQQAQQAFDAQMAQLERRREELTAQLATIHQAREQLSSDRGALAKQQEALKARVEEATRLADDKGFQDSLALYQTMPGKQVKAVFMGLDDPTVIAYLQAMSPRNAGKIIKEFKSPEEISRIQKILEQMRQAESAQTPPAGARVSTEGP